MNDNHDISTHQVQGRFPALKPQVKMENVDHLGRAESVTMINVHSEQSEQHSLWIRVVIIALLQNKPAE